MIPIPHRGVATTRLFAFVIGVLILIIGIANYELSYSPELGISNILVGVIFLAVGGLSFRWPVVAFQIGFGLCVLLILQNVLQLQVIGAFITVFFARYFWLGIKSARAARPRRQGSDGDEQLLDTGLSDF